VVQGLGVAVDSCGAWLRMLRLLLLWWDSVAILLRGGRLFVHHSRCLLRHQSVSFNAGLLLWSRGR